MSKDVIVGVDVGGTNTDAVVLYRKFIIGVSKTQTTDDVVTGVKKAIVAAVENAEENSAESTATQFLAPAFYRERLKTFINVKSVHIGTTVFLNALLQGKGLQRVAVIRLCGSATQDLPPFCDFPEALREIIEGGVFCIEGGFHFDGIKEINQISNSRLQDIVQTLNKAGIQHIVVSGVFSPLNEAQEESVAKTLLQLNASFSITKSSEIGSLGLLSRENAAIVNESLKPLAQHTIGQLQESVESLGAAIYFTQNNGTLLSTSDALVTPVLTFASGPTNSMRGAAFLTGIKDALVVDVGGTTTDVGLLHKGFPRLSAMQCELGGVKTNFRMPNVLSITLGGGSIVQKLSDDSNEVMVGPDSVGAAITQKSLSFGGNIMTTTDIANAAGISQVGRECKRMKEQIDGTTVAAAVKSIQQQVESCVNAVRISKENVPVILVGGGSVIVDTEALLCNDCKVIKPKFHYSVANAVGAALSQISGTVDTLIDLSKHDRDEAVHDVTQSAISRAVAAGAAPATVEIVDLEEVSLPYLPGNVLRVKAVAVGDIETFAINVHKQHSGAFKGSVMSQDANLSLASPATLQLSKSACLPKVQQISCPQIESGKYWCLSPEDIEAIAIGAGILGCGGGGNPYLAKTLALHLLKQGKTIKVVHPQRVQALMSDDDVIVPFGCMGAPTVIDEILYNCKELASSVQAVDWAMTHGHETDQDEICKEGEVTYISRKINLDDNQFNLEKVKAILPAEIGGGNSLNGLVLGAVLNLPVVDGDGMGRAFPELQQCTLHIYSDSEVGPAALASHDGRQVICLSCPTAKQLETFYRTICIDMGCTASLSLRPIFARELEKKIVPFSVSRAWHLGQAVLKAQLEKTCPIETILRCDNGRYVCKAKVTDVHRSIQAGFTRGTFTLEGLQAYDRKTFVIEFQNEFLAIKEDEKVLAVVPDLITVVDLTTGEAISTDLIRYGLRVAVLQLPAPPQLCTPEALDVLGPEAFGYKSDMCDRLPGYVLTNPVPPAS